MSLDKWNVVEDCGGKEPLWIKVNIVYVGIQPVGRLSSSPFHISPLILWFPATGKGVIISTFHNSMMLQTDSRPGLIGLVGLVISSLQEPSHQFLFTWSWGIF